MREPSPLRDRLYNLLGVQSVGIDEGNVAHERIVNIIGGVYEEIARVIERYGEPNIRYVVQHKRYEVVRRIAS
jgi:hypothetical protein